MSGLSIFDDFWIYFFILEIIYMHMEKSLSDLKDYRVKC